MKIKDCCELLNGYAFKSTNYKTEGCRVIRITNVQSGYLEDEKPVFYDFDIHLNKYELKENDLLISLTGNVGRCALVTEEFLPAYLNQRVCCLRTNDKKVLPKFLYYALNSKKFEIDCINSSRGIAQLNMSTEWLKEYNLKIPRIEVQKKIINIFDKIYKNINIKKRQIDNYNKIIKSQFIEMFGTLENNKNNSKIVNLNYYADMVTYGLTIRPNYISKGIPLISATEIKTGNINYDLSKKISLEDFNKLSSKAKINKGDLLFGKVGASIGYCAIVEKQENIAITQNIARIVLKENCNPIWIRKFLETDEIQNYCKREAKGNAMKDLQIQTIKSIPIFKCDISHQNKFAEFVKIVDKQKSKCEDSLKKIEELQFALMQEYFG